MSVKDNSFVLIIKNVLKATIIATIFNVVLTLLFTVIAKTFVLSSGCYKPVNQFIKIISLFLGIIFSVKDSKGLIKGVLIGILTPIIVLGVFSLFGKDFLPFYSLLIEVIFSLLIGGIFGIIAITLKSKTC